MLHRVPRFVWRNEEKTYKDGMLLVPNRVMSVNGDNDYLWNNHLINIQIQWVQVFDPVLKRWNIIYRHVGGIMSKFIYTSKHIVIDCYQIDEAVVIDANFKSNKFAMDGSIRCANDEFIIASNFSSFIVYNINGTKLWTVEKPYTGCSANCCIIDSETFIVGDEADTYVYVIHRGEKFQYIGCGFSVIPSDNLLIFHHKDYIEIKNRQLITIRKLNGVYNIISPEYIHMNGILYNLYGQELREFNYIPDRDYESLTATLPPLSVFDKLQPHLGMLPDPLIRIVESYI